MLKPLLFILLLSSFLQGRAQDNWKEVKDRNGIKVYTRLNEGYDFKEFKGVMTVSAKLSDFVAVLQDIDALPSWGYKIKETTLLNKSQDTVLVYYLVADTPFPYHDRDGVYKNVFRWDGSQGYLLVEIMMEDFPVERSEGLVQMNGYGSWIARPLKADQLEITFQMQVDPGGGIPAWLANLFAGDSPYHTLMSLREKLKDPAYRQKNFQFLE